MNRNNKAVTRIDGMTDTQEFIASLNDLAAKRTRWGPASGGGASFQEHTLVEVSPNRLEFRMASGARVFYYALITVGVGCLGIALYFFMTGARGEGGLFLMLSFLPGLIGGLGSYFTGRPRVFDLETGWYWKGRKPRDAADLEQRNNCTSLTNVYALQILRETVHTSSSGTGSDRSSGSTFDSYELNLVLNDGSRINGVEHGKIDATRRDAARLSEFLGVPVWDATLPIESIEPCPADLRRGQVIGTVFGGCVYFIVGAAFLAALAVYLDNVIGNGVLLGILGVAGFAVVLSMLIATQLKRIRKRPLSQSGRSQVHNESPVDAPWGIDSRPRPTSTDPEEILPAFVGDFQRGEIRASENIYVEYTDGRHVINMELGVCRTPEDSQQVIRTYIAESADVCVATEAVSIGTDPSFHKGEFDNPRMGESGKGVGIAWSRGRYYFSAGARTRDVLNIFMTAFPY